MFGYALLGAGWLCMKTEGEMQPWARARARWAFLGVVLFVVLVVSVWTPIDVRDNRSRWFAWPDIACSGRRCRSSLRRWRGWSGGCYLAAMHGAVLPFIGAIGLVFRCRIIGLIISACSRMSCRTR